MKITNIIWLDRFVEKLWRKHGVTADEVEQVFNNRPQIQFIERGDVKGENVYRALGQTYRGRYLAVFFIDKGANTALVISAREMSQRERKSYGKQKK
jgi:uncharacterized DUF497 family protein